MGGRLQPAGSPGLGIHEKEKGLVRGKHLGYDDSKRGIIRRASDSDGGSGVAPTAGAREAIAQKQKEHEPGAARGGEGKPKLFQSFADIVMRKCVCVCASLSLSLSLSLSVNIELEDGGGCY